MTTPDDKEFWSSRGIDPFVQHARPYIRYRTDEVTPVRDGYERLSLGQIRTAVARAKRADGILIRRHNALPGLPPIVPEMRPDEAIWTGKMTRHWHGYGDPPEDDRFYRRLNPYGLKGKDRESPGEAHRRKEHGGENTEEVHEHEVVAKYLFPSNPRKKTKPRPHDHDDAYPLSSKPRKRGKYSNSWTVEEKRLYHVKTRHGDVDVAGDHTHEWTVQDHSEDLARRLDVHPWAVDLFEDASTVYFVIEGCLKADSVLSAIRRGERLESVFSVPSVSLWLADELAEFARLKLRSKQVVVVPDADWVDNPLVIEQARLCCLYLQRRGFRACVAAPPEEGLYEKPKIKGIDDHLGAGRSLDDLVVQKRLVDTAALWEWLGPFGLRLDAKTRDLDTLYGLSYAAEDGVFTGTLKRFAKVMNLSTSKVWRGVHHLEELGALTIDGDLSTRANYYTDELEWEDDPPTLTLIPELRGEDGAPCSLGELLSFMKK